VFILKRFAHGVVCVGVQRWCGFDGKRSNRKVKILGVSSPRSFFLFAFVFGIETYHDWSSSSFPTDRNRGLVYGILGKGVPCYARQCIDQLFFMPVKKAKAMQKE
jgi:hypothetical protein